MDSKVLFSVVIFSAVSFMANISSAYPVNQERAKRSTAQDGATYKFKPKKINFLTELMDGYEIIVHGVMDDKSETFETLIEKENGESAEHCKITYNLADMKLTVSPSPSGELGIINQSELMSQDDPKFMLRIIVSEMGFKISLVNNEDTAGQTITCPTTESIKYKILRFKRGLFSVNSFLMDFKAPL